MNITIKGDISFFVRKFPSNSEGEPDRVVASTYIDRMYPDDKKNIRHSLDIIFDKNNFPSANLARLKEDVCYVMNLTNAWLTLNRFKKKGSSDWTYNIAIYIKSGKLTKATAVDVEKREKARAEAKAKEANFPEIDPLEGAEKAEELPDLGAKN